jgi:hypothetical protein
VGDARDRLAERRHFFGLQQLVINVARFVVQLLAFTDIPNERFDPQTAVVASGIGAAGDFHPHRGVVRTPQPEQVVGHGAVGRQPFDEREARLRVDERFAVEGADLVLGGLARIAEDQFEVGVGGDRGSRFEADRPDIDALANGFEEPREGGRPFIHEPP